MKINISDKISTPEFDYIALTDALKAYKAPRKAIHDLIKLKKITRIKKGIYIQPSKTLVSLEILANIIVGPSYISKEYALS